MPSCDRSLSECVMLDLWADTTVTRVRNMHSRMTKCNKNLGLARTYQSNYFVGSLSQQPELLP